MTTLMISIFFILINLFVKKKGPMDATVVDFWRMVVEQGCGICVMLTNLEENGKLKCVKYWPEAGQPQTFGKYTIRLVKEKCFAGWYLFFQI